MCTASNWKQLQRVSVISPKPENGHTSSVDPVVIYVRLAQRNGLIQPSLPCIRRRRYDRDRQAFNPIPSPHVIKICRRVFRYCREVLIDSRPGG